MANVSRDGNSQKESKEMLEIKKKKTSITEMKSAFDKPISRLDMVEGEKRNQ